MNARIWGIIGGVALVLALLSPLVLGSAQKVERLFEAAEVLYERSDYEGAIVKYKEALKESKKFGAKTERIDKDFTTLANLRIARCYYELAENSSDIRHYQSALTHVRKVVLDVTDTTHEEEFIYLWAKILYKTGDLVQAMSKFSGLIEKFPNSQWIPNALYATGNINLQQESYQEALNAFKKLIDEFPDSELKAEAERHIAELALLCDESVPPVPDPCEAMYEVASNLQRQGKVHDAYQLYTDLIARFPECEYVADAYVGKAEIHLEAEDYVKARINYEEAMRNTDDRERRIEFYEAYHRTYLVPTPGPTPAPTPNDELFVKARLLRMEERFLEAAEIYEPLANRNLSVEDTAYALYWSGRCYHNASLQNPTLTDGRLFRKSVDAFKKLISNYENSSYTIKTYYYLSLVYKNWAEKLGDQFKCQLVIDTVEEANTKYANAGSNDTTVQGWLSRMQELKEIAIQKLIPPPPPPPPPPPDPEPLVNQGYIHLGKGELEKATKNARQALDIDSNYSPAHELLSKIKEKYYGRGWTFFDEEQYNQAIDAFQNAISIDPKFKEAHNHLGVVYIKQGKYLEAIVALEEAINIEEAFKEAYFNLALAHLELGEFEDAINAALTALRIDPNYEPADMIIKLIGD